LAVTQQIKDRCHEQFEERKVKGDPIKIVSDKLEHYRKGFNKYFLYAAELIHGVPIACRKYGLRYNNNPIERDNERIKQRVHGMREFQEVHSGEAILWLLDSWHNFIHPLRRKREKRERTPAVRSGIMFNLGEHHRLLKLVRT
jgi:transposase-like protein